MEMTYECAWDTCDYQFEDLADCMEHCIGDGGNSKYIYTVIRTLIPYFCIGLYLIRVYIHLLKTETIY